MDGLVGLSAQNKVRLTGSDEEVDLFDCHVKADTILFGYLTPDGWEEVKRFPLAGFCENYLAQFVK